ncbi:MAG: class I SAM-dependent methyltransferase [Clostridia bacterium]|nr:class I SAM-dependent methyltransferase [Clostridia bacterium]
MNDASRQNKAAWEYDAYAFWCRHNGSPGDFAARIAADPRAALRRFADILAPCAGQRIANICGSCGKKAIPLALLGAKVTVFDISAQNARYALETAAAAGAPLEYVVGDVLDIDPAAHGGQFDVVFMEGGVLHYFHDITRFMSVMRMLLKPGGRMVLSDFHPFTKLQDTLGLQTATMSYFSTDIFEGEMAHARFYDEETRRRFPQCAYRKYTISEIINAVLGAGFILRRFDEHPAWDNPTLPGEFTLLADLSTAERTNL